MEQKAQRFLIPQGEAAAAVSADAAGTAALAEVLRRTRILEKGFLSRLSTLDSKDSVAVLGAAGTVCASECPRSTPDQQEQAPSATCKPTAHTLWSKTYRPHLPRSHGSTKTRVHYRSRSRSPPEERTLSPPLVHQQDLHLPCARMPQKNPRGLLPHAGPAFLIKSLSHDEPRARAGAGSLAWQGSGAAAGARGGAQSAAQGSLLGSPPLGELYSVLRELGKGQFGVVRLVQCRASRKLFACKTFLKSSLKSVRHVQELKMEILSMAQLQLQAPLLQGSGGSSSSAGLVRLHEVLDDGHAVYLVEDYCEGGDLLHHIVARGRMREDECAAMLVQLLFGLKALHAVELVHRDIKPDNILLERKEGGPVSDLAHFLRMGHHSSNSFRLADLGSCARLESGAKVQGKAGSPKYMAPEVVQDREYGREADVWSLGVVLYACLSGEQAFSGDSTESIFKAICECPPKFSSGAWQTVSPEAKRLVQSMLCRDPTKRITIPEILKHSWLLKFGGCLGQHDKQETHTHVSGLALASKRAPIPSHC